MSRLTFLFILITLTASGVLMASGVRSQNLKTVKVSVRNSGSSLKNILDELEKQSGFNFYFTEEIGDIPHVVISKDASTLYDVLKEIAGQQHLRFSQSDELIAITKAPTPPPLPTGAVKGRIVEFETSQPLPAASVYIVELKLGSTTTEQGYYRFANVPAGKYTLRASYVGYKTEQVLVEVKENKEVSYDLKLQSSNALNAVVVTGRKARSKTAVAYTSDKELLTEIRESRSVVSGISNEQIVKSADRNAAEVVKRIPGVTVTDDRFIVVRGMNQRYNLTYLNGNIAPETEVYSKAFAYDLIPSQIIDRILVYKSPSPDLLGDFAGGAVKVFTKNAKPVRHLDIGFQTGYREGVGFSDINSYKGGKLDWLGFDDGGRKLPGVIPGYLESGGIKQYNQEQLVKAFNPDLQTGHTHNTLDFQGFLNYYDNFKLGKGRVYNLSSITYTNETREQDMQRQTGNTYSFLEQDTQFGSTNKLTAEQQTTEIGKLNVLQNFTYKLDKNNQFEFNNFFLNEGRKTTDIKVAQYNISPFWTDHNYGQAQKTNLLGFQQRLLYTGNLDGQHHFNNQDIKWNLGYTYSEQNVPDQRVLNFYSADNHVPTDPSQWYAAGSNRGGSNDLFLGMLSRLFVKNTEDLYNFSADYTYKLSPQFDLKAGTYNLYRYREVARRFFKVNRAGLSGAEINFDDSPTGMRDGFGYNDPKLLNFTEADLSRVWSPQYFNNDGTGLAVYDVTSPVDSYEASEQNNSGYLMGEYRAFGDRLVMSGGLRVEYDLQKLSGALDASEIIPIFIRKQKTAWLPSINISYTTDSSLVIRGGYGKTVNRPDFREMTPYNDFDFANNELIVGNPDMITAAIDNYDLRLELYPKGNPNEIISVGGFYKNLLHPIEKVRQDQNTSFGGTGFTRIGFNNADQAKVYGVEAEVRKSFSFIPGKFFRNLSMQANAALIKSSVRQDTVSTLTSDFEVGKFSGRRLQGQAPYVVNLGLYYENPAWGTKISASYNISGTTVYAVSPLNKNLIGQAGNLTDSIAYKSTRPSLIELPRHQVDLSISQRLYKTMQLKLNVQNLLNQSYQIAEDENGNDKYDPEVMVPVAAGNGRSYGSGDDIYLQYKPRRYYTLTFTYSF